MSTTVAEELIKALDEKAPLDMMRGEQGMRNPATALRPSIWRSRRIG